MRIIYFLKHRNVKRKTCMKKYVVSLCLLLVQNTCAMEMSSLLEKYSRKSNQKTRIGAGSFLCMSIRRDLPFELQNNIFVMMHEIYEAEKEKFIEAKIREFKFFVDDHNHRRWPTIILKDDYISLLNNNLCQLFNKSENHSFCQKNNKNKVLLVHHRTYVKNIQEFMSRNYFPGSLQDVNMTETITKFIKKHYESIIMFWRIVNTKLEHV